MAYNYICQHQLNSLEMNDVRLMYTDLLLFR